jgi:hypothetical protein
VIDAHPLEQGDLGIHADHRFVVAVAVDGGPDRELRRRIALAFEELREQQRLIRESPGVVVVGEQIHQLVTKGGDAARLHHGAAETTSCRIRSRNRPDPTRPDLDCGPPGRARDLRDRTDFGVLVEGSSFAERVVVP